MECTYLTNASLILLYNFLVLLFLYFRYRSFYREANRTTDTSLHKVKKQFSLYFVTTSKNFQIKIVDIRNPHFM